MAFQPSIRWSITVLLADDDEDDRELIGEAIASTGLDVRTRFVTDGQELFEYLRHEEGFTEAGVAPRPSVILLDLNMPRMNGREVLAEIKSDPALRTIPVVVLTTSSDEKDVEAAYDLGASSYLTKPMTQASLVEMMDTVMRYWSEVELPEDPPGV